MASSADNLIWIDLEMTGLDPLRDQILEIATIVTDKQLVVLAEGPVIAIHQADEVLASMDAWNTRTHTQSGLVARVRASTIDTAGAQRRTLFTLDNHQPAPFLPERLKGLTTQGITLMLDVPRVADGPAVLDRMLDIARDLAAALGGRLVDDNRAALSDAGIARIREQLQSINAALAARDIAAGGERALRLFS